MKKPMSSYLKAKQLCLVLPIVLSVFVSACHRDTMETLSCNDINSDLVLHDKGTGVDYVLNCVVTVNAKLTIDPGVTIQFGNNAGFIVETTGAINAVGTSAKPIVLKGNADAAGVWRGIQIRSNNVENHLEYCSISNAGSSAFDGSGIKAAIRLENFGALKFIHCTIDKSAGNGLYVGGFDSDNNNPLSAYSSNVINNCQLYPINAIAPIAGTLDGTSSTYSGNTNNKIYLRGGRLFGSHTWKNQGIPLLLDQVTSVGYFTDPGNLTIEAGNEIRFMASAVLVTGEYSTSSWLNISGSSAARINLTADDPASPWKGVVFQSTSGNNNITYADISYGGSTSYSGNLNQKGNILAGSFSAGSFSISNCTVNNSASYGIYATATSPVITVPASVSYSANASGNYFHE